jgi:DNA-binding transcriptional MerR regulator
MADGALMTIGELARLAGLTVKTVRFWSDEGLVPAAGRTAAGYRLYGPDALVRAGLVRTLRDLGVGLPAIRKVLGHQVTMPEVAARHAAALEVQIRTLRLRQAVLKAVASRGTVTAEEIQLMNKLAQLSAAERRRLISEFIDDTFDGLDVDPGFLSMIRGAMPDLPDEPTQQQIHAWVELAELVQDPDFRASLRRSAAAQAKARAEIPAEPSPESHREMAALLRDRVATATAAGIEPGSAEAGPVADELVAAYARHFGRENNPRFRAWLLAQLESGSDNRYERYWQLLAVINCWPAQPSLTPAAEWLITELRGD